MPFATDTTTFVIFALLSINIAVCILFITLKRFHIAVFLIALAPFISALFAPNAVDVAAEKQLTIGSYLRVGIIILLGFAGVITYLRERRVTNIRLPVYMKLLGVFSLLAFISTVYSVDFYHTLVRAITLVSIFGFLLGLYVWIKDKAQIEKVFSYLYYCTVVLVVLNFAAFFLLGEQVWWVTYSNRFLGLWGHPNMMGSFCMISYFILLWKYTRSYGLERVMIILLIVALAVMHVFTGSRGSLLAALFGVILWFIMQRQKIMLNALLWVISLAAIVVISSSAVRENFHRESESKDSYVTLTGRTEFWSFGFSLFSQKPLLGHGFDAAGEALKKMYEEDTQLMSWSGGARPIMHNGYIDTLAGLGLIGLVIWILLLFIPFRKSVRAAPCVTRTFCFTVLLICFILNIIETTITTANGPVGGMFWMIWLIAGKTELFGKSIPAKESVEI